MISGYEQVFYQWILKNNIQEIKPLKGMKAWEVVGQMENENIIDSSWIFKLKWFPDGSFKNIKSLFLCLWRSTDLRNQVL